MAWLSSGRSAVELQRNLTKNLCLARAPRLQAAWAATDRAAFVPPLLRAQSYSDYPLPLGHAATISAPHMHALQLSLLKDHLPTGGHVLDVGSGSGFCVAFFARLVCAAGGRGRVVGVEHIPELAASSLENVAAAADLGQFLLSGQIAIRCADGREGWQAGAPYDAIHVGAAAPQLPTALIEQLAPGGRMVIPIEDELCVFDKGARRPHLVTRHTATAVRFVPLCDKTVQEEF
jgi:protein-L-isoaspartate(D-aspartate) O-methyltransferase